MNFSLNQDEKNIMLLAYRHDEHKFRGAPHSVDREDKKVPYKADLDSGKLSRPSKKSKLGEEVISHYRISLLTRQSYYNPNFFTRRTTKEHLDNLLKLDEPIICHENWLKDKVVSGFNEDGWYPYTSLKYHTLITATLLFNYMKGNRFENLFLIVKKPNKIDFTTIFLGEKFSLHIMPFTEGFPSARIVKKEMNFNKVWQKLYELPIKYGYLDSCLRNIGSWSMALQLIEDWNKEKKEDTWGSWND